MQITQSSVGRKLLMSITGLFMVLFVCVHVLGNSSIFFGPNGINAYAKHLHDLPPLVWLSRLVMGACVLIHAWFGIQVSVENSSAKPKGYAVTKHLKATLSSKSMIWTGLVIIAFVVYHLLQFTIRVTPDIVKGVDALGRFDVFNMVTTSFKSGGIAFVYLVAMSAVLLHLSHGIQSFFQTMGWSNDCTLPKVSAGGRAVAFIIFLGYVSIPVFIFVGILNK